MLNSERLAAASDLLWRRRQGQVPDPRRTAPNVSLSADNAKRVERIVARLAVLAPLWNRLPIGGELAFVWPSAAPNTGS
jgi:hypothetical protein